MKKLFTFLAVFMAGMGLMMGQVKAASFSNGGFEQEDVVGNFVTKNAGNITLTNWIIDGSIDHIDDYWQAQEGDQSIDLNGNSDGIIHQVFDTEVNTKYYVTFYLSGNPDGIRGGKHVTVTANSGSEDLVMATYTYDTSVKGNTREDMKWEKLTFSFVAKTTSTSLWFISTTDGAYGPALDNIVFNKAPTTPVITGFLNPSLPCGAITNIHYTTVEWTDSTDENGILKYEYQIHYPKVGGGYGDWTTFPTISQYSGSLNEGIHTIKVRAIDNAGNVSEWSNECTIIADWTAPDVTIDNPADESILNGVVDIYGTVVDLNLWRYWFVITNLSGGVVAGPGTVYTDVGFNNKLLLSWDTTLIPDGKYIIKLEARDKADNKDSGSIDWHKVTVDNDADNDGVPDKFDLCQGTLSDPSTGLGTNRWRWNGDAWMSLLPSGKSKKAGPLYNYSDTIMADTKGCSCEQILAKIEEISGDQMEGHHKFGCSKSVVDDFIKDVSDGDIDGYNKKEAMETVMVPALSSSMPIPAVTSMNPLLLNEKYLLKAYETAFAGDEIEFDAVCSFRTGSSTEWTDLVSNYHSYGAELLDLFVDGSSDGWGSSCDLTHTYYQHFTGKGVPVSFYINDVYPYNNSEELKVDIFEWVY